MNKIDSRGAFAAILFLIAASANHSGLAHVGDPWGSFITTPEQVCIWQKFLKHYHFGLEHDNSDEHQGAPDCAYPNQKFDAETVKATLRFQSSYSSAENYGKYNLPATGIVNRATYLWAVKWDTDKILKDMPKEMPQKPSDKCDPKTAKHNPDYFRQPMIIGYNDSQTDSESKPYNDVNDWQTFLVEAGYLGAGYPTNTFGTTTAAATTQFQIDSGETTVLKPDPTGQVGEQTYNMAVSWGMPSYSVDTGYPHSHNLPH